MRVQLDGGEVIELGTTEETPTIGMVDYSRRETDDFGVTTVVPRAFSRRMSVRMALPTDEVDALQRRLAALRATAALWTADERFAWLSFRGFYKDFEINLEVGELSYCTLTVEGLADGTEYDDPGGDPAPEGELSTLKLLQPAYVPDAGLVSSTVAENDYPEWQPGTNYPAEARVIMVATHRIYESAIAANLGNNPTGDSGKWSDIGPTNRWAMLDGALGSATTAAGSIEMVLDVGMVDAIALLDVSAGATVEVGSLDFSRTAEPGAGGAVLFLDLPATDHPVTVTINGPDADPGIVSVGTLMLGRLVGLGVTETSPTAAITDYSRKEVDDFGEATVVERDWAKRMTAKALIATDAIDMVAGRIAKVRARPSLWIGDAASDALTVFGFFKDFSIEAGPAVSKLSLSIQGFSTAGKIAPLGSLVEWPDIADPDGTKPEDNATYGAPGNSPVGLSTGNEVVDRLNAARAAIGDVDELTGTIIGNAKALEQELRRLEVGGNLLVNSDFNGGTVSWGLATNEPQFYDWGVDNGDFVFPDEHYQGLMCTRRDSTLGAAIVSEWEPVDPGTWVQASAWIAARECLARVRLQWGDINKNYLMDAAESDEVYNDHRGGPSLDDFDRVWCIARMPAQGRYARLVLVKDPYIDNPAQNLSWAFMLRPMLAVASATQAAPSPYLNGGGGGIARANALIEEVRTAATSAGEAAAQIRQILAVNAGGQSARLNTVEQVAATAFDRVTGARWSKEAIAGSGRAQLTVYAFDNNGNLQSGVDIIGDLTISGNLVVNGSIITNKLAPNAAQSIQWARTSGMVSLPYNQQTRIMQLTFQKTEQNSTLDLLANIRMKSGDDITGVFRLINFNSGGGIEDSWPIWMVGANDNFQVPIALNWMATGWAPGTYTLAIDYYNQESDAPTWAEAGCTIKVQEIKR